MQIECKGWGRGKKQSIDNGVAKYTATAETQEDAELLAYLGMEVGNTRSWLWLIKAVKDGMATQAELAMLTNIANRAKGAKQ